MNTEDVKKLQLCYARLTAIRKSLPNNNVEKMIIDDFHSLLGEVEKLIAEDTVSFIITHKALRNRGLYANSIVRSKLEQLIAFLEVGYGLSDEISKIGSLVGSIKDSEIRARCLDLLSASSKFDRVINQATQVLEDRIREKSGEDTGLEGTKLTNKVIKGDPTKTILKFSDEPSEQEGIANIMRGVMMSFRNPTHHKLTDDISREEALKLCGFIDLLLGLVDHSEKQ